MTPGVPGAPEPRMYLRSGYFLFFNKITECLAENFKNESTILTHKAGLSSPSL